MLSAERREQILQTLNQRGTVRVTALAEAYGVNPATIRRDLNRLDNAGRLRRVHGGAVLRNASPAQLEPSGPGHRIAEAAARFIPDDSVLFLGPGSLTCEMVPFLMPKQGLTLITNALNVAWQATQGGPHRPTLHVIGGQVEDDYGMHGSPNALPRLRADYVVLEAGGLDAGRGFTHDQVYYAEIARGLFDLGAQIIALLPPERVGRVGAVFVAPAEEVDILVTGREAPNAPLWDLSELGLRVVLT